MAETEGFEPSVPLRGLHLSRVVHSTGLCDVSEYGPTLPRVRTAPSGASWPPRRSRRQLFDRQDLPALQPE